MVLYPEGTRRTERKILEVSIREWKVFKTLHAIEEMSVQAIAVGSHGGRGASCMSLYIWGGTGGTPEANDSLKRSQDNTAKASSSGSCFRAQRALSALYKVRPASGFRPRACETPSTGTDPQGFVIPT